MLRSFAKAAQNQATRQQLTKLCQTASFATASKSDLPLNATWCQMASKEMKGKDVHQNLVRETNEQMLIKPLYTSEDVGGDKEDVELPGKFPYKRGPYATMYTHRPWTIRQYAGFSTVEESNKFYRANLAAGQ